MRHPSVGIITGALLVFAFAPMACPDDGKVVAALDTEYQAAVRAHDVLTMDRILADDFVLVTARGRVYSKADLLQEARDPDVIYERQEDTNQTVRVWGDTAVITALLWAKRHEQGEAFRLQALVQRYLRADGLRLAIRVRPGLACTPEGAVGLAL